MNYTQVHPHSFRIFNTSVYPISYQPTTSPPSPSRTQNPSITYSKLASGSTIPSDLSFQHATSPTLAAPASPLFNLTLKLNILGVMKHGLCHATTTSEAKFQQLKWKRTSTEAVLLKFQLRVKRSRSFSRWQMKFKTWSQRKIRRWNGNRLTKNIFLIDLRRNKWEDVFMRMKTEMWSLTKSTKWSAFWKRELNLNISWRNYGLDSPLKMKATLSADSTSIKAFWKKKEDITAIRQTFDFWVNSMSLNAGYGISASSDITLNLVEC